MTPETTPSSSGSDTSKRPLKSSEERLMVAVRIRPLKSDEPHRALYAVDKKVKNFFFDILVKNYFFGHLFQCI